MANERAWRGFARGRWSNDEVDVRDFIQRNYTPYEGDGSFLAPATEATRKLWQQVMALSEEERKRGGVYKADTSVVSRVNSHAAGYLDKQLEIALVEFEKPLVPHPAKLGGHGASVNG